jgi:hypothetical protein
MVHVPIASNVNAAPETVHLEEVKETKIGVNPLLAVKYVESKVPASPTRKVADAKVVDNV